MLEPALIAFGELLPRLKPPIMGFAAGNLDDARAHLNRLVFPGFARGLAGARLKHYPRYLKALALRVERLLADPAKEQALMLEVQALDSQFASVAQRLPEAQREETRWLLEEFRVSLFAQELGTAQPVSAKRIGKLLET